MSTFASLRLASAARSQLIRTGGAGRERNPLLPLRHVHSAARPTAAAVSARPQRHSLSSCRCPSSSRQRFFSTTSTSAESGSRHAASGGKGSSSGSGSGSGSGPRTSQQPASKIVNQPGVSGVAPPQSAAAAAGGGGASASSSSQQVFGVGIPGGVSAGGAQRVIFAGVAALLVAGSVAAFSTRNSDEDNDDNATSEESDTAGAGADLVENDTVAGRDGGEKQGSEDNHREASGPHVKDNAEEAAAGELPGEPAENAVDDAEVEAHTAEPLNPNAQQSDEATDSDHTTRENVPSDSKNASSHQSSPDATASSSSEVADTAVAQSDDVETDVVVMNWAGTHTVLASSVKSPESIEDLEHIVREAHAAGHKIRPVGNALSPNGLAFESKGMLSLAQLDKIVSVDVERREVTVQAGAQVSQVLAALRPHGLTLENFSSIQAQQMGGWTQVAAHGTGAGLPTVDEMITRMRLITPAFGALELSEERNKSLFRFAKVGIGALGVVADLTLKCVPMHRLHERTFVVDNYDQLRATHADRLQRFRHVRYMWLPYTGKVVVVVSDPVDDDANDQSSVVRAYSPPMGSGSVPTSEKEDPTLPLKQLLSKRRNMSVESMASMSFADLRDELLRAFYDDDGVELAVTTREALDSDSSDAEDDSRVLDSVVAAYTPSTSESTGQDDHKARLLSWTRQVNAAEAAFWTAVSGERVADSTEILGFECGGSQWVLETAFPCGTREQPDLSDVDFVIDLLNIIESNGIAAPCPIEQRWTARSTSYLSPAYSEDPDQIFHWVGIIMYMPEAFDPSDTSEQAVAARSRRQDITRQFQQYAYAKEALAARPEFNGFAHWSKVEIGDFGLHDAHGSSAATDPESVDLDYRLRRVAQMRERYAQRFPAAAFDHVRSLLDPKGILSNDIVESLLGWADFNASGKLSHADSSSQDSQ